MIFFINLSEILMKSIAYQSVCGLWPIGRAVHAIWCIEQEIQNLLLRVSRLAIMRQLHALSCPMIALSWQLGIAI